MCAYVWFCAAIAPWLDVVNEVCEVLSPQSTSTVHGASFAPWSLNEPRSKLVEVPSSAVWFAGELTSGATLATVTIDTCWEFESLPPSLSATLIATLVVFGPSGNEHLKLPPVGVVDSEPSTYWPLLPQSG